MSLKQLSVLAYLRTERMTLSTYLFTSNERLTTQLVMHMSKATQTEQ